MPTDNPKISGYVSQAVYTRLMGFKKNRGYQSVSQAVTAALEEFFGLRHTPNTPNDSRMETLEKKIASLGETVAKLSQAIATLQSASNQTAGNQTASSPPVVHSQQPPTEVRGLQA